MTYLSHAASFHSNGRITPSNHGIKQLVAYDVGKQDTRYEGMTLSVNAANLFDKRHIASCFFNNSCYFGAPRTVVGTLRYGF